MQGGPGPWAQDRRINSVSGPYAGVLRRESNVRFSGRKSDMPAVLQVYLHCQFRAKRSKLTKKVDFLKENQPILPLQLQKVVFDQK